MSATSSIALVVLSLIGCNGRELYFSGEGPSVTGVAGDAFEPGNIGGHTVVIQGSGFGGSADNLVVRFGSVNAEIVSVTDTELTVVSPVGPITGGWIDLQVADATGMRVVEDFYEYQVPDVYDNQAGYIRIEDYYSSPARGYFGDGYGVGGGAEFYDFQFPRLHTGDIGWSGGNDWSPGDWTVELPAYSPFAAAIDDLRVSLPDDSSLALVNSLNTETWCADLSSHTFSVPAPSVNVDACQDEGLAHRLYDTSRLEYCELREFESDTNEYAAEWLAGQPFFAPEGERNVTDSADSRLSSCQNGLDDDGDGFVDSDDPKCHPEVVIEAPGTGYDGSALVFPEPISIEYSGAGSLGQPSLDTCSGATEGSIFVMKWWPSGVEYTADVGEDSDDKVVEGVDTYVRVSVTALYGNWFGTEFQPARATITVPDVYNTDEDGMSVIELPVEVMNQFPEMDFSLGSACDLQGCNWKSPDGAYGFMVAEVARVTEYRLSTSNDFASAGDLVVSYATGDFGIMQSDFTPPVTGGTCSNCSDDDGDGWVDAADPDCVDGTEEDDSQFGVYGCNDGLDNDGDGDIDADDDGCSTGLDGETNCSDGIDNDGDGWIDELDVECEGNDSNEDGLDVDFDVTCTNGVDDDNDGWIDADDPDCADGGDDEVGGFGTTACNDGIDNDGHGDVDSDDFYCFDNGALEDSEQPEFATECQDGIDNDDTNSGLLDNYIDEFDPACETGRFFEENKLIWEAGDLQGGFPGTECYDGVDNDGDGAMDAEDPGCWNPDFDYEPDGFLNDEGVDQGTGCTDGLDEDADGWIDGLDPDCQARDVDAQDEVGLGTTECNDGADNDSDTFVDADDPDCDSADGTES
jgi:hypothetical protein